MRTAPCCVPCLTQLRRFAAFRASPSTPTGTCGRPAPCYHHGAQYEVATGRQLFARGGSWDPGEFDHSEDFGIYGEHAFITDMGHQRLVRLNTRTKRYDTYRAFEQPQPHQRLGLRHGIAHQNGRRACATLVQLFSKNEIRMYNLKIISVHVLSQN